MKKIILLNIALFLLLAGCAQSVLQTPVEDNANRQIAEAATSVSDSLRKLAYVQEAATPPLYLKHLFSAGTEGMQGIASLDWSGPVGQLVEQVSNTTHYKLRVIGRKPAIPIIVSINAKNVPIATILRDADYQAGKSANIAVYSSPRVIELRYANS